jgi:prolipoprotein diacylglyceryl transferase
MLLAEFPSPTQGVWNLGPFPIRAYALCIILGIVVACVISEYRLRSRGAPKFAILDIALPSVLFGIVGARIYHVITSPDDYFGEGGNWVNAFRIWHGGLGIWGAIAGGAVGALIAGRRLGIPLAVIADAMAPALPAAQAVGRWGNWFNNELFGGQTTLPWGLKVYNWDSTTGRAVTDAFGHPDPRPGLYHPTFLYESLWDVGVALLVWLLDRKYKFGRGRAFALYAMAYTVGRFWIEALRIDPAHSFGGLRINNWVSVLVFAGALIYFLRVRGPRERLVVGEDGRVQVIPVDAPDPSAEAEPSGTGPSGTGPSVEEPADEAEPPPSDEGPAEPETAAEEPSAEETAAAGDSRPSGS